MKKKISIDGAQSVEVSKPVPCEKSPQEQLAIMEAYTQAHRDSAVLDKAEHELRCLRTIFPALFRSIEDDDLLAGRLDFPPIGFGSVANIGDVSHCCAFHKLRSLKEQLDNEKEKARVDALYAYWEEHDTKVIYCTDVLDESIVGRFIDYSYPLMAIARLSGMMLNYRKLMACGLEGLKTLIRSRRPNTFLNSCVESLTLLQEVIGRQIELVREAKLDAARSRLQGLESMERDLAAIRTQKPATFHQALQLFRIYALVAGVINHGRMDDVLEPYLQRDLEDDLITKEEAYRYLKSLWKIIENRRIAVNERIIVGGEGREHPEEGDTFARICLRVCRDTRYVEPQFTLRFNKNTPADITDVAYDCIGSGAAYPTLYNDDVNIEAVVYGMRVSRETTEQYVPFGCGEFMIQGKSVGTPNILLNLLKLLNITLNAGIDPMDDKAKNGPVSIPKCSTFTTFDELYDTYKELLDYYLDLSVETQKHSYEVMNQKASFLFTSVLMDDCITRGRALLDDGVQILGGINEIYGDINASDALYAIRKLVYEDKVYTLQQLHEAQLADFGGYEQLRKDLLRADKYGDDKPECGALANDLYEFVVKGIRQRGIDAGPGYYLIVISNNQTNTDWGHQIFASLDGRKTGIFMDPANNPQGGAAKSEPIARLNPLSRFQAKYHGGSVQSIRFTPRMFNEDRDKIRILFNAYFKKGGYQLMVTVVDHGVLEDAQKHPEKYPDLIMRVASYNAVFVNLIRDIQGELPSRMLYD